MAGQNNSDRLPSGLRGWLLRMTNRDEYNRLLRLERQREQRQRRLQAFEQRRIAAPNIREEHLDAVIDIGAPNVHRRRWKNRISIRCQTRQWRESHRNNTANTNTNTTNNTTNINNTNNGGSSANIINNINISNNNTNNTNNIGQEGLSGSNSTEEVTNVLEQVHISSNNNGEEEDVVNNGLAGEENDDLREEENINNSSGDDDNNNTTNEQDNINLVLGLNAASEESKDMDVDDVGDFEEAFLSDVVNEGITAVPTNNTDNGSGESDNTTTPPNNTTAQGSIDNEINLEEGMQTTTEVDANEENKDTEVDDVVEGLVRSPSESNTNQARGVSSPLSRMSFTGGSMVAYKHRHRTQQSNETGDGGDGDSSSSGSSSGSSSDIEADEGSTADEEQDDNSLVSGIGDLNIVGGDVEDAGEMSPSEEAAGISLAIMIQARIRGVRTRSYLARCAAAATVIQARIQALVRGIRTRSVLTRRAVAAAAATTIQARIRGAVTRNQNEKIQLEVGKALSLMLHASIQFSRKVTTLVSLIRYWTVTKIQARIRGFRTRSYLARCVAAAIMIQALVRGERLRQQLIVVPYDVDLSDDPGTYTDTVNTDADDDDMEDEDSDDSDDMEVDDDEKEEYKICADGDCINFLHSSNRNTCIKCGEVVCDECIYDNGVCDDCELEKSDGSDFTYSSESFRRSEVLKHLKDMCSQVVETTEMKSCKRHKAIDRRVGIGIEYHITSDSYLQEAEGRVDGSIETPEWNQRDLISDETFDISPLPDTPVAIVAAPDTKTRAQRFLLVAHPRVRLNGHQLMDSYTPLRGPFSIITIIGNQDDGEEVVRSRMEVGIIPPGQMHAVKLFDHHCKRLVRLSQEASSLLRLTPSPETEQVVLLADNIMCKLNEAAHVHIELVGSTADIFNVNEDVVRAREALTSLFEYNNNDTFDYVSSLLTHPVNYAAIGNANITEDIYCGTWWCTNRRLEEKEQCMRCRKWVCTLTCFDYDTQSCHYCDEDDDDVPPAEEEENEQTTGPTLADFDEALRIRRQHDNKIGWNALTVTVNALGGYQWRTVENYGKAELNVAWNQGLTSIYTNNEGRRVPLKNLINAAGHWIVDPQEGGKKDVTVTDLLPDYVSKKHHTRDVRSFPLALPLKTLYSEPGDNGNIVKDSRLDPKRNSSTQEVKDRFKLVERNALINSLFLALFIHCPSLIMLCTPVEYHQVYETRQLMSIPIGVKQESLQQFLYMIGYPQGVIEPMLDQEDETRRDHTESAKMKARAVLNHNYAEDKERINSEIEQVKAKLANQTSKNKEYVTKLKSPASIAIMDLIDETRRLTKRQRTPEAYAQFKMDFMDLIELLRRDLPQFKSIIEWNDIAPYFTLDQFQSNNWNNSIGQLTMDYFRLVGRPDITDYASESYRSYDLDHVESEDKDLHPSQVAAQEGAYALLEEVIKFKMLVKSGSEHKRDEQCHSLRGQDEANKHIRFMKLPLQDRSAYMTPSEVIVGDGNILENIGQLISMSDIEREKFLVPIKLMFLICSLHHTGAFSEYQEQEFDMDTIRAFFVFYFGLDADDFTRKNANWINACKGKDNENRYEVADSRKQTYKSMLDYLICSMCKFDPDEDLRDEYAAMYNLSPKEYFDIDKDHCGKKNCGPSEMISQGYGLIFMLNETLSALLPMKKVTHKARSVNQDRVAGEKGIKRKKDARYSKIERDFTKKSIQSYSSWRKNALRAYN